MVRPALDLTSEVGVPGRVDDVDGQIAVADGGVLGQDGDALLPLEIHRVEDPIGDLLIGPEDPGLAQHGVHQRGLAVVDVGHDGDIAEIGALHQTGHRGALQPTGRGRAPAEQSWHAGDGLPRKNEGSPSPGQAFLSGAPGVTRAHRATRVLRLFLHRGGGGGVLKRAEAVERSVRSPGRHLDGLGRLHRDGGGAGGLPCACGSAPAGPAGRGSSCARRPERRRAGPACRRGPGPAGGGRRPPRRRCAPRSAA